MIIKFGRKRAVLRKDKSERTNTYWDRHAGLFSGHSILEFSDFWLKIMSPDLTGGQTYEWPKMVQLVWNILAKFSSFTCYQTHQLLFRNQACKASRRFFAKSGFIADPAILPPAAWAWIQNFNFPSRKPIKNLLSNHKK